MQFTRGYVSFITVPRYLRVRVFPSKVYDVPWHSERPALRERLLVVAEWEPERTGLKLWGDEGEGESGRSTSTFSAQRSTFKRAS